MNRAVYLHETEQGIKSRTRTDTECTEETTEDDDEEEQSIEEMELDDDVRLKIYIRGFTS